MMRGELATGIFFVVAIALVSGFLALALMFPELLPWYRAVAVTNRIYSAKGAQDASANVVFFQARL